MSSSVHDAEAVFATVDDGFVTVTLRDGRRVSAPLDRYPRLASATEAERRDWRVIGQGEGIHWPLIDEDLSVEGLLRAG